MITLPHHVEFLSDAWLAEAKSWLEREVAERKTRLSGPFSISGVFTDAPPHLNLPGNVASWQASFDGDSISVVRGANENADCLVGILAIEDGIGDVVESMARSFEDADLELSDRVAIAFPRRPCVLHLAVRVGAVEHLRPGQLCEYGRTGNQVFVAMGLEDMGDPQAFVSCLLDIDFAVPTRVDNGSLTSRPEQVRKMGKSGGFDFFE